MTTASAEALLNSQVTADEARAKIKGYIASSPSPIPDEVLATPGTVESAIVWAVGESEAVRSEDRAAYAQAGYRSTAPLEWLRLHAREWYGMAVRVADYATTTMQITNTSGFSYGLQEKGSLRFLNRDTRVVYESTADVDIQAATLTPYVTTVGVKATVLGSAGNATVGQIDRLETTLEGLAAINVAPAVAQDDEDAPTVNRRIDARIGLFGVAGAMGLNSGGPKSAAESIAYSGADSGGGCKRDDGTRVTVTRAKFVRDDTTGIGTLYVADDDGPLTSGDLVFVNNEVQFYAEWVSSRIDTINTSINAVTVSATVTIRDSSSSDEELFDATEAAFPSAGRGVPIGGFPLPENDMCPVEYIEGAIRGAFSGKAEIIRISVYLPTADVVMADDQVVVFTLGVLVIQRI